MHSNDDISTLIDAATGILEELRVLHDTANGRKDDLLLGNDIISVIWVSCAGLARLAKELGVSRVDKISTTTEHNISNRLSILGRDQYGATIRAANGHAETQPGFSRWIAQAVHVTRPSLNPAIRIRTRSLAFDRPSSLSRRAFDTILRRELSAWALDRRYPSAKRYTIYKDLDRLSRAEELVVELDPRTDGDKLLAIIEGILAQHPHK